MKYTPKIGQIKFNFRRCIFFSKYSEEFRIKVVNAYLLGEGGAGTIVNSFDFWNHKTIC